MSWPETAGCATAGNAGGALAAYAARAGMESWVLMPEDTPVINQKECLPHGAKVFAVNGLIDDCGRLIREGMKEMGRRCLDPQGAVSDRGQENDGAGIGGTV